jgi:hypothetical protein
MLKGGLTGANNWNTFETGDIHSHWYKQELYFYKQISETAKQLISLKPGMPASVFCSKYKCYSLTKKRILRRINMQ